MKRFRRRSLGVIVGLSLGWLAAGIAYPPGNISLAAEELHAHVAEHAPDAHPAAEAHDEHGGEHHEDEGLTAAKTLVPRDAAGHEAQPAWFGNVITLIVGLFIAAIILGVPCLKAKGGDPAGLATAYDQSHANHDHDDAHGHDDHGHAAGGHTH